MQRGFTKEKREKLIRALLNFDNRTREDVAGEVGADRATIWRWLEAEPDIWDEVYKLARKATTEVACESLKELRRVIKRGRDGDKLTAIKMLWQYRGELVDRTEAKVEGEVKVKLDADLSDDDARRIATALLARREGK